MSRVQEENWKELFQDDIIRKNRYGKEIAFARLERELIAREENARIREEL